MVGLLQQLYTLEMAWQLQLAELLHSEHQTTLHHRPEQMAAWRGARHLLTGRQIVYVDLLCCLRAAKMARTLADVTAAGDMRACASASTPALCCASSVVDKRC